MLGSGSLADSWARRVTIAFLGFVAYGVYGGFLGL